MLGCVAGGAALGVRPLSALRLRRRLLALTLPPAQAVILPIALNRMFAQIGFANAIRVIGGLDAILLIIANAIMRPRQLPKRKPAPTLPLIRGFLKQPSTWLGCGGAAFVMLG